MAYGSLIEGGGGEEGKKGGGRVKIWLKAPLCRTSAGSLETVLLSSFSFSDAP